MTKKPRSYTCQGCGGIVAIPKGRRTITLDQVRTNHQASCPTPTKKERKHGNEE